MTRHEEGDVRRRVWVQNVAVQAAVLEARLEVLSRRHPATEGSDELVKGIRELIQRARDAAYRDNPIPSRWGIWWRGTLIEAAYQNLHAAEALIVGLYNDAEVDAEVPEAVARVETGLSRDDPRRVSGLGMLANAATMDLAAKRERLRKLVEIGHASADRMHSRLRSFRNLVLGLTALIAVFMAAFVVVVSSNPSWVPLCFTPTGTGQICPTGSSIPSGQDILVIMLLGLLGGALAGAVSIRNVSGTATPYEVPTALAMLKVPFGAMTAIGMLIAIRGDFVPGLSALDSQVQILAYALVFGYAQQLLTGFIDRQAQSILNAIPSKDTSVPRPEIAQPAPGSMLTV